MNALQTGIGQGIEFFALALFTAFTTSGICAFAVMAARIGFGGESGDARMRLERFLVIPLGFAVFGLIAAAAHLGRPSNVLFVLTGAGRSPLSNEIVEAVAFFAIAGLVWYASFSERISDHIRLGLLGAACVAGALFMAGTANAYSIATIVTWNLPYTQVNMVCAGIMGAIPISLLAFSASGIPLPRAWARGLLVMGAVASLTAFGTQMMQYGAFASLRDATSGALDLVPFCYAASAGSLALAALSLGIDASRVAKGQGLGVVRASFSCAIMMGAIVMVRFVFYAVHMTVGF